MNPYMGSDFPAPQFLVMMKDNSIRLFRNSHHRQPVYDSHDVTIHREILFHRVGFKNSILTSGVATSENTVFKVHDMK
jgi:hypothetical protein